MKPLRSAVIGVLLARMLVGCSVRVEFNEKDERDLGTHHVVVKPGSTLKSTSSSTGGGKESYSYSCGGTFIRIQDEELIVNNMRYGTVKAGEGILVDHGKVFVAGQQREGVPLSEQERASAEVLETVQELAGYRVTVRPGASLTMTSQILGKHTLTVAGTKVAIKRDELFVNGRSYGALKPGDSILVDNLKVAVSGQVRQPKK